MVESPPSRSASVRCRAASEPEWPLYDVDLIRAD
jgi:hypothetical protein